MTRGILFIHPLQRLPMVIPPVCGEVVTSYADRLSIVNHLPEYILSSYISIRKSFTREDCLSAISTLSGYPPGALRQVLPELKPREEVHTASPSAARRARDLDPSPSTACRLCMRAKGILESVEVWMPRNLNVCRRHRRWVGQWSGWQGAQQFDLTPLPEVLDAHRQHIRQIRRHGMQRALHCFHEAEEILMWADRASPHLTAIRRRRARQVTHNDDPVDTISALGYAIKLPEIVGLASLLLSPYWRALGSSRSSPDTDRFIAEVRRTVWPDYEADVGDTPDRLQEWRRRQFARSRLTHGGNRDVFPLWLPPRHRKAR